MSKWQLLIILIAALAAYLLGANTRNEKLVIVSCVLASVVLAGATALGFES